MFEVPFDGQERPWTLHLVGWREGGTGQVSSPVVMLDPASRKALTRSGRAYELGELPGLKGDAFAAWGTWKQQHGLALEHDTTEELQALLLSPRERRTQGPPASGRTGSA